MYADLGVEPETRSQTTSYPKGQRQSTTQINHLTDASWLPAIASVSICRCEQHASAVRRRGKPDLHLMTTFQQRSHACRDQYLAACRRVNQVQLRLVLLLPQVIQTQQHTLAFHRLLQRLLLLIAR